MATSKRQAAKTVGALFRWQFDMPSAQTMEQHQLNLSKIACIVVDSGDPMLSKAYAMAKAERGICQQFWTGDGWMATVAGKTTFHPTVQP